MKTKATKIIALLIAALLMAGVLAGCGGGGNNAAPGNANNAAPGNTNNVTPGNTNDVTPGNNVEPPKDDTVYVSSIEELLEAIKPDAKIVIKSGSYDFGEALRKISETQGSKFEDSHEYLSINTASDGYALVVSNVDNLSISGESGKYGDTKLLNSYKGSDVLWLRNCSGLKLTGLTMGHIETSDCTGDVLVLTGCRDAALDYLDLYGCGVYALRFSGALGDLSIKNCVLRDCSSGAFYDEGCSGNIVFEDCNLTGSDSIPHFELSVNSTMVFKRCNIGVRESEYLSFCDYVILENCQVAEPEYYPEFYSPIGVFVPDMLEEGTVDTEALVKEGKWLVFTMAEKSKDITAGEYKPYVNLNNGAPLRMYLTFAADGTGVITGYKDQPVKFTWAKDKGLVRYELEGGTRSTIEFYTITDQLSGEYDIWLCMDLDGYDYWITRRDWM